MNAFAVLVKIKWNQGSSSEEKTQVHLVDSEKFIIGRGVESSIVLPDPSISRKHLGVLVSKGTLLVKDLSTNNITYVDGQKTKRGEVYTYKIGQPIKLGTFDAIITFDVIQKVLEPSEVDFDGVPTDVRDKFNNLIVAAQHVYQDNERKSEQLGQKIIENNTREGNLYIEEAKAQAEEILKRCEHDATRMIEESKEKETRLRNEIVSEAQKTAKALFDEASMFKERTVSEANNYRSTTMAEANLSKAQILNEANNYKKTTVEEAQETAKHLIVDAKSYYARSKGEADDALSKTKQEVQQLTFDANEMLNKTKEQVRLMSDEADARIKKIKEATDAEVFDLKAQAQDFLDQSRESNLKASLDADNALREANAAAEQIFKTKKEESEEHAKRVIAEARSILAEAEVKAEKISNETVEISRKFAQEKADKIIAEAYKAAERLKEDLKKQYEEMTSQRMKEIEVTNRKKEEELRNERQKWITERDVRDKILNQEYDERKQQYLDEHEENKAELDRSRQTLMDLKNKLTQNDLKNKDIEETIERLTESKNNIESNLSKLRDEHSTIVSELKVVHDAQVLKFKTEYEILEKTLMTDHEANKNRVKEEFAELNKRLKDENAELVHAQNEKYKNLVETNEREHRELVENQRAEFEKNQKEFKEILHGLQVETKKTRDEAELRLKDRLVAIEVEHVNKLKEMDTKYQATFEEYKEKSKLLKEIQFDITEASRNIAAYRMQIGQLETESQNAKSSLQAQIHNAKEAVKIEHTRHKQDMERELQQIRLYEREKAEKEIKDTLASFSARKEKFALLLTQDLEGLMANFLTSSQTLTDPQNVIKKEVRQFVAKAFDENYIELSRVLDKDVKMEVAQLSEERRVRIKTWALGAAGLAVVYYVLGPVLGVFDDKFFRMTNERGESAQQEFTREQREIKEAKKFVPVQTADWKSSFVDNFIYTSGFYQAQSNKDYENDWIRKLYRVFVKEMKMDDEVVARLVGIERSMFSRLEEEYKQINPDFVEMTVTKMRTVEKESEARIKDILKTDAKYSRFERERREFWQPRLDLRVPASKAFEPDAPKSAIETK